MRGVQIFITALTSQNQTKTNNTCFLEDVQLGTNNLKDGQTRDFISKT